MEPEWGCRPMLLKCIVPGLVLASLGFSAGCREAQRPTPVEETAHTASPLPPAPHQSSSQRDPQGDQMAHTPAGARKLEDVEEHKGPFTLAGLNFTVELHYT